jgi:hypothetical protein
MAKAKPKKKIAQVSEQSENFVPIHQMTDLQVHVRGTYVYKTPKKELKTRKIDYKIGKGAETWFYNIGNVYNEYEIEKRARQIYSSVIAGTKTNNEGLPV